MFRINHIVKPAQQKLLNDVLDADVIDIDYTPQPAQKELLNNVLDADVIDVDYTPVYNTPPVIDFDSNLLEDDASDNLAIRLSSKRSTNPGDYPDIRHFESWAQKQPIEYAMAYDRNGQPLAIVGGDSNNVSFPPEVVMHPNYMGMTHNHPNYSPLSSTDLRSAAVAGNNVRAIGDEVYEFNPGWLQGRNAEIYKFLNATLDMDKMYYQSKNDFEDAYKMLENRVNTMSPDPKYPLFGFKTNDMTGNEPYMIRSPFNPVNLDFEIERDRFKINNKHNVSVTEKDSYEPTLGVFI